MEPIKDDHREIILKLLGVDINIQSERIFAGGQSIVAFNLIYLIHHFVLPPADFHPDLAYALEDETEEGILIIGYRGSAKSTYGSLSLPLRSALYGHYHFLILLNETTAQMKVNILNIRKEVEDNELIKMDFPMFGKFKWTEEQLEFPDKDVLILGRSRGQKIRGMRYRQYRPDLIVADDVEDLEWVRKKENRDKTERWWNSEVIPAQDETRFKLVVIGNLLHNNALMMRLKKRGLYKVFEFALFDDKGNITWKGKYPDMDAVEKQKKKVGSSSAWSREYLLKVISEDEQVIKDEDITYYPVSILSETKQDGTKKLKIKNGLTSVDLAISEKETADYTAIIGGLKAEYLGKNRILIKPNPINKRMDFDTSQKVIKNQHSSMPLGSKVVVEDVAYQKAAIQELDRKGIPVKGIRPITDKRARLETVAPYIKDGTVMFADVGNEELVEQLLGFGMEAHDDLVDALVYLILEFSQRKQGTMGVGKLDSI